MPKSMIQQDLILGVLKDSFVAIYKSLARSRKRPNWVWLSHRSWGQRLRAKLECALEPRSKESGLSTQSITSRTAKKRSQVVVIAACLSVKAALAGGLVPRNDKGRDGASRSSFYLRMRDGVKIAVDLNLPQGLKSSDRIPALVRQTRYYRSFDLGWKLQFLTRNWPSPKKLFLAQGYAWLDVDVRGTGASFGHWIYPWSPDEIRDGAEIVDWIVRQPWSNGKVGAIGASYDGGSAELMLVNRQPAVTAVAPEFTFFDAYSDLVFPGGIWLQSFSTAWQTLDRALDINYVRTFKSLMPRIVRSSYHGVRPVDSDVDRALLSEALREHEHNLDVAAMARAITYRDDAPWPPSLSLDAFK